MFRSLTIAFLMMIAIAASAQDFISDSRVSIAGHDSSEDGLYLGCSSVSKTWVCVVSTAFVLGGQLFVLQTDPIPVLEWSRHKLVARMPTAPDGLSPESIMVDLDSHQVTEIKCGDAIRATVKLNPRLPQGMVCDESVWQRGQLTPHL